MKANLDCVPCLLRQSLEASRRAQADKTQQERILRRSAEFLSNVDYRQSPPEIAHHIHAIVREVTGNEDPYKKLKDHDNKLALTLYPCMKEMVAKADDSFMMAVRLAIVGNIIDYGVGQEFDVLKHVKEATKKEFTLGDYPRFKKDLAAAKTIMYLADNAGEIVFDRLLIEEIVKQFGEKDITVVVKGGPIINDATVDDAKNIGIDKLVKLDIVGNGMPNTGLERSDPKFISKLKSADLVIAKGQGNFEALSEEKYIYFLLMAKCQLVARELGVPQGSLILKGGVSE
ncbi:MAG: ARMT1-like domain-containing protein [Candidatus Altiarchaeota archaeon]